ncbi:MAG TPA: YkgJ family cysteine cluster protein [Crenotrichaceae bacterium]|nr:YkgJ family cysteine cluster protein [Crenotrichaceae bacterium]
MSCRAGCGACCIAPEISSPIPGMPDGKPAGVRCIQLDATNQCRIFNDAQRPAVCEAFKPSSDVCQNSAEQAMQALTRLENLTRP